jgi:transcription elongation GreA/GreB family factor
MENIKNSLYQLCLNIVEERLQNAQLASEQASDGAGEETKSSAGDKYETAREMMQQEKDRAQKQANEANKLMVALQGINTSTTHTIIQPGSVVLTDNGNFYVSISAGALNYEGHAYVAISPASPIGVKMLGLKPGDGFEMNGRKYKVAEVF